jgi:chlorite dismutase
MKFQREIIRLGSGSYSYNSIVKSSNSRGHHPNIKAVLGIDTPRDTSVHRISYIVGY